MSDVRGSVDLKRVRAGFVVGYLALLMASLVWVYASHRNDALNVGGAAGDVDFWIRVRDVGVYSTLALWAVCVIAALGAGWAGMILSTRERIYWSAVSIVSAPLMTFVLHSLMQ